MEIQQLRYFLEVAKEGHVTRAAEKLHIAQPALSQAISRLENELDVRLFDHKGRNIILNPVGNALVKKAEPLLKSLDELPAYLKTIAGNERRTININLLSASHLLTDIIIAYRELNPNIYFHITQNPEDEDWDLRITTSVSTKDKNKIVALKEEIFLVAPINSNLAKKNGVSLIETKGKPYITFAGTNPFRRLCDSLCHSVGMEPRIVFESDNPASVRDLIGAGLGIAFWPAYSWGEIKTDKVKLLHITNPKCFRNIVIVRNESKELSDIQEDFFRFIIEYTKVLEFSLEENVMKK